MVYLINNHADYSGHDLYGGSIDSCIILKSPQIFWTPKSSHIFNHLFNISNMNPKSITSSPTRACFCAEGHQNCSKTSLLVRVVPGGKITIGLILVGQRNSPTPGTLGVRIASPGLKISENKSTQVFNMHSTCQNVSFSVRSDRSTIHGQIKLFVSTTSDISFTEHLSAFQPIRLNVTVMQCSLGFVFSNSKCGCSYLRKYNVYCNSYKNSLTIEAYSHAWVGDHYQNNTTYLAVTDFCPSAFCHHKKTIISSNSNSLEYPDKRCQNNRMGVMCGDCTPNSSLYLGSNQCVEGCSYSNLFLIILFLVLGLLLVFFLTILDLTVAEGTIGGILFYANVVQVNSDIYFFSFSDPAGSEKVASVASSRFGSVCKAFIAWLNLDLGIPMCFYPGLRSYDKMWLQYLSPLYIWFIAGAIIYLSKRNTKIAALLRSNCIKVLSTLILLSYAKMTRLTMEIFRYHRVYLYDMHGNLSHTHFKWALDGKIEYFSREHSPLFIAGVITAVVLAPYTVCLLFIRRLYKHSSYRILWWINKWQPFFDTHIGSYTDKWYCWTGVQLLARFLVLVANEAQSKVLVSALLTLGIVLVLLAFQWWGEHKVYKKRWLNVLEGVSLLNLAFLQLATVYTLSDSHFSSRNKWPLPALFSVVVTMVLFVGVVFYHGYRQLFSLSYFKEREGVKNLISQSTLPPLSDSGEIESFHTGNKSRLFGFSDDRECLLAKDD